jgi:hypothetical protein
MTEWIDVNDRLPEKDQKVLTFDGNNIETGYFTGESDSYYWDFDTYGAKEGEITYWMPLPDPPAQTHTDR